MSKEGKLGKENFWTFVSIFGFQNLRSYTFYSPKLICSIKKREFALKLTVLHIKVYIFVNNIELWWLSFFQNTTFESLHTRKICLHFLYSALFYFYVYYIQYHLSTGWAESHITPKLTQLHRSKCVRTPTLFALC